jgi:sulfite reductase beta subunit-like hemoprotein
VQPQRQEGLYFVNIPLLGGGLTSDQMFSIADLADEYGNGDLRLTLAQNLIIPNVELKDKLVNRLQAEGFSLNKPDLHWNSMGCTSDFCGRTIAPHAKTVCQDVVTHLEKNFDAQSLNEAGVRIHVSGCSNNCCANLLAEIGLAGRLVREHGEPAQTYDVLLGGGSGTTPTIGTRVEESVPALQLGVKIETLFRHYFRTRQASETLREFCANKNLGELKTYLNPRGG